jgi:CRP-like cAMP-binding protein
MFLTYLESIITVSAPLKKELLSLAVQKEYAKGELVLNAGERCTDLYFINKGLLRGFYFDDAKEITNWFAQEGEFGTSFFSFVTAQSSSESIQALENCELLSLSSLALQKLYKDFPETERIGRIITENYYIRLEERLLSLQFKTAKERYTHLFSSRAPLLQRASLGQIASYLGITQETLSRIRAEV